MTNDKAIEIMLKIYGDKIRTAAKNICKELDLDPDDKLMNLSTQSKTSYLQFIMLIIATIALEGISNLMTKRGNND